MRYLSLKIQAFGPYDEAVTFPLEKLPGLFTITGDTGAGKSTIFDALTFALFGKMSGSGRREKDARCTYSPDSRRTEVTLKFFHVDKEYTVTRWFRKDSKGKLTPDAKLITEGDAVGGHEKVTEAIYNLIHLDAEQFRMVAILPQGEFSKLLKADQKSRAAIIKSIFNTQRYGGYVERLKAINEQAKADRDGCRTEIIAAASPIKSENEELNELVATLSTDPAAVYDIARIIEFLGAQNESDSKSVEGSEKELQKLKNEAERCSKAYSEADELLRKQDNLRKLEDEYDRLYQKEGEMADLLRRTERSETAVNHLKPMADSLDSVQGKFDTCKSNIGKIEEDKSRYEAELADAQSKADAARTERDANSGLKDEKVLLERSLGDYAKADEQRIVKSKAESRVAEIEKALGSNTESRIRLSNEKESNNEFLAQHREVPGQLGVVRTEQENAKTEKDRLENLQTAITQYGIGRKDVTGLYTDWSEANDGYLSAQKEADDAYDLLMKNQYGIIARDELKEGMPCPVCGSLHHPAPACSADREISNESVKKLRKKAETLKKVADGLRSELDGKNGALDTSRRNIIADAKDLGLDIDPNSETAGSAVSERIDAAAARIEVLNSSIGNLEADQTKMTDCTERNTEIEVKLNTLAESDRGLNEERANLCADIFAAEAILTNLGLKYATKAEAEAKIAELGKQIEGFENAVRDAESEVTRLGGHISTKTGEFDAESGHLKEYMGEVEEYREKFEKVLADEGFASREEYESCLVAKEKVEADRKAIDDYKAAVFKNGTLLEQARKELEGKQIPESVEALKAAKDESQRLYDDASGGATLIQARFRDNTSIYEKLVLLREKFDKLDRRANSTDHVYAVANGGAGSKKMSYDAYVQEQYFQTIVEDAAARFYELSGEAFRMYSKSAEGESMDRSNLKLWVRDLENGGERVIDSLSGGETFLASLSLALGMADMIQRCAGGKSIESLLIDEGFGTLDKEALSKSIKHLGKVAGNKGSIGLITHLDSLIAAIPRRVEISRETGEGSRIEIY